MNGAKRRAWTRGAGVVLSAAIVGGACSPDQPTRADDPINDPAKDPAEDPAVAAAKVADPSRTPGSAAQPGVAEDGSVASAVPWFAGTVEAALAKAKAEDKLVLIDVGAYWCPPCHRLDEELFVDPTVGAALAKGYVSVHIDAEKGEGPELAERYHVQAYPTMLILEATGLEKARIVDFIAPAPFLEALTKIAAGGNVLEGLAAEAAAAPDDLPLQYKLGHAYALAARRQDAERVFATILVADPQDGLGLASKVLYDRALFITHKLDGKPADAIAQFQALQRRFPNSKAALRAYAKIARLHARAGREAEAVAAVDAMLATDPDDVDLHASYGWFCFREKTAAARGLQVVRQGLAKDASRAELYYLAAELSALTGDGRAASVAIERAAALEPESAYYRRQVRRFADEEAAAQ